MNTGAQRRQNFAYQAQTDDGLPISGTIEADNAENAHRQLDALGLRVTEMEPVGRPAKPKALGADDFIAFNQQLAHLTSAGLPVEQGLRLIAQDMRSGRLAATIRRVSEELERGRTLAEAFEAHRGKFPTLYARIIDAGVKSANLPGVLLNLGRHLDLVHRLRAALWRAAAYPLVVLFAVALVMLFLPRQQNLWGISGMGKAPS